jgi:YjbE family integral membrane protein
MDVFSMQFLSALAAIVVIDLVLAGDNAIVIALATRRLPQHLRKSAILWGTAGAVAFRSVLTIAVVWLLAIPGLMLAGGAMLVWIAYKLLADKSPDQQDINSSESFWSAIRTIVVADIVMGLDNVLGVAGAAHGNFLLVVLGLLISIPIVVGGSQLILKLVDRFPAIIYLGAAVLAWTAARMITSEPLLADIVAANPWISWIAYGIVVSGVLGMGFRANRMPAETGAMAVAATGLLPKPQVSFQPARQKEGFTMTAILIPVDASANSLNAVRHAASLSLQQPGIEVHLLNVRVPLPQYVARFLRRGERRAWHTREAERALAPARELLDRHGVAHASHVETGEAARTIDRVARRLKADQIVVGSTRMPLLARLFRRSLTTDLMEISTVPVQVIAGERASAVARYGVPVGIGALIALILVAAD